MLKCRKMLLVGNWVWVGIQRQKLEPGSTEVWPDGLMHSKYGQQDDHESAKLALDPRKAKATVLACSSYEGSRTLDN